MLLPTSHWAQSSSFIVQPLYHIFSTQNKWYNYNSLLSLTQANYSVIMARISCAHSLLLAVFLSKVMQAVQKSLAHKGWVRQKPLDMFCWRWSYRLRVSNSVRRRGPRQEVVTAQTRRIKESRHREMPNLMGHFWCMPFNLCKEIGVLLL